MKKSILKNEFFKVLIALTLVFTLISPNVAQAETYKKGQNVVIDNTIKFKKRATGTVVVTMLAENMTIYGEQIYYEFEDAKSVNSPINFTPQYGGTYTAQFTVTASDSNGNPVGYSGAKDVKVFVANEWYDGDSSGSDSDGSGQDVEVLDPSQRGGEDEVTTERVQETESIPFETRYEDDPNMQSGEEKILTEGKEGRKITTYEVTYVNGKEDSRIKIGKSKVTEEPVTRVIARGTTVSTLLSKLTVEGASLEPEFSPETYEYTLTIDENTDTISFIPELENENAVLEGDGDVKVNESSSHQILIKNDQGESSTYTFRWDQAFGQYFITFKGINYRPAENVNMGLSELIETKVLVGDKEIKAYKDSNGNMITPLDDENGSRSWFKIDQEGNILKETPYPFSISGVIYHGLDFVEISDQIIEKYGLERTKIEALRIDGYKFTSSGMESKRLVRLGRLDGEDFWYEFNSNTNKLTQLEFSDVISMAEFEEYMDEYKSVDSTTSNISPILIIVAVVLFILLLAMILLKIKKNRQEEF